MTRSNSNKYQIVQTSISTGLTKVSRLFNTPLEAHECASVLRRIHRKTRLVTVRKAKD